ncbi:MAG: HlyD family efflux transporter periplasmic adaptor subunit [Magnetococcales bacterium]|nr:HlyD family efflux transporter periplasmic adaptor subunit [Magnetococcales bacterium]
MPTLPPLREELTLHPGPRGDGGFPTWTLHDPAAGRFFRLGWPEFEILARWELESAQAIADAIDRETTLRVTPDDVAALRDHLQRNHLLRPQNESDRQRFLDLQKRARPQLAKWMLHNYLFLRIPLWHPDRFLQRLLPRMPWLFTHGFAWVVLTLTVLGLGLVIRQWEAFQATFLHFFDPVGMVAWGGALLTGKGLHELGHALTARHFGCRVPSMGVALLVLWPVFYTETSEAWKLASRRERLAVGGAGMAAELILAGLAACLWGFLEDGPMRSAAFLLASSTWIVTLTVNLNPLMRFDGYFLLADALDLPNLQERAFAMGRWKLREWLFGWDHPPPEPHPPGRAAFLIGFAWAVWCYRFFLFAGIALLVYHFFFKLLGLFLFLVEIGWFILRPVGREIMAWHRLRKGLRCNRNLVITLSAGMALLVWSLTPVRFPGVAAPAILQAGAHTVIHAPTAALVTRFPVRIGQQVTQGEPLIEFDDPELRYRMESVTRTITLLRWELEALGVEAPEPGKNRERAPAVVEQELTSALAEQRFIAGELEKLRVLAPFAGTVAERGEGIEAGDRVASGEALLTLIDPRTPLIKGYVAGRDLPAIIPGMTAIFHPDDPAAAPLHGRVLRKDPAPMRTLPDPELDSRHGGGVPVRGERMEKRPVEGSFHRVDLTPDSQVAAGQVIRGVMTFPSNPERPLLRLWNTLLDIFHREGGF